MSAGMRLHARLMQGFSRRRDALLRRLFSGADRSYIAMFPEICPDGAPLPDEFACPAAAFTAWLDGMLADGWRFLTPDALLSSRFGDVRKRCCLLTFDDGFSSLFDTAKPLLDARNVPFTAYVTAGYLGKPDYLTQQALSALAADPLAVIGSHSVTHPMFRFLPRDSAVRELTESRKTLERLTGKPVRHFAFPYGSAYAVSRRDIRLAKACGYESAALTAQAPLVSPGRYGLPRLNMPEALNTK